jgi:hypothetical protein
MNENPMDLFVRECPELARALDNLVDVRRNGNGLDAKTSLSISRFRPQREIRGVCFSIPGWLASQVLPGMR